jgi:hypothetical protein
MQNIDYNDVSQVRSLDFDIVQIFLLRYLGPGCCNSWEKDVLFPLADKFKNYSWYNLYIDQTEIPFPPVGVPSFYIYFKDWKYPFVFTGEKSYKEYETIFQKIIQINEGIHPTEIFN